MKSENARQDAFLVNDVVYYLILPLIFGYLSTLLTGYSFGISNNVYHIPYVLNLENAPEFKDDAYYATLKNMTSVIWPIIRAFSDESNIERVFYIAFIISRVMAYVGIIYLLRKLNVHALSSIIIALIVVTLSQLINDSSIIGDHGMFADYFSHSEVTWLFVFLSFGFLSLEKVAPAYAVAGIAFSINAFVGIWLLFINTFALIFLRKPVSLATIARSVAGFALFALPVILWIYFAVSGGEETVHFKYIDYIREYNPQHFLIESSGWNSLIKYILVVISGLLAARHLPNIRFWVLVQLGALMIIIIGIPLPYIIDNRFVFNLHLIRSAGVGQAIATILIIISGVKIYLDKSDKVKSSLGVIIMLSMLLFDIKVVNMFVVMISMAVSNLWIENIKGLKADSYYRKASGYRNNLVVICGLLFATALLLSFIQEPFTVQQKLKCIFIVIIIVLILLDYYTNIGKAKYVTILFIVYAITLTMITVNHKKELQAGIDELPQNRSWNELVTWVKKSNLHGPFLLLNDDHDHTDYFQLQARKQVWVDWKQGAAVMWSPSFYEQWSNRITEVSAIHAPDEYIKYAHEHSIHYIVLKSSDSVSANQAKVLKRTEYYTLYGI